MVFLVIDLHTRDIARQQVRSELDALVLAPDCLRKCSRQGGLTGSGEVFEKHVPLGDHRREDKSNLFALAEHGLLDVFANQVEAALERGDLLFS